MPESISNAIFRRLRRSEKLKELLLDLHALSGLEALFIDALGNEVVRAPRDYACMLRCIASKFRHIEEIRVGYRQSTLLGHKEKVTPPWYEIIQPLFVGNEICGYVVLSACRGELQDEKESRRFWSGMASVGLGPSWKEWHDAWLLLPVYSGQQRRAWLRTLRIYSMEALRSLEDETGRLPHERTLSTLVKKACSFIKHNHEQGLTLEEVARHCGVSKEHLSREFHKQTGLRYKEYLTETRVRSACELLVLSDLTMTNIANQCGFSTLSRFNASFKKITGMTPGEWRKRKK